MDAGENDAAFVFNVFFSLIFKGKDVDGVIFVVGVENYEEACVFGEKVIFYVIIVVVKWVIKVYFLVNENFVAAVIEKNIVKAFFIELVFSLDVIFL